MKLPRRAFTIVELLVVMTIMALLLGILLPALSSAVEAGRTSKCASNLRQFGFAMSMYLKDNNGIFPPHRLPRAPDGSLPLVNVGTGMKVRPRMAALLAAYMEGAFDNPSATDQRQTYDSPIMQCATVPHWTDERNYAYGYNYQFLGNTRARVSDPAAFVNFPVHQGAVDKPTRTIMLADSMGSAAAHPQHLRASYQQKVNNHMALGNHAHTIDPPYLASHAGSVSTADPEVNGSRSAIAPRHNGRANVLFVDGHVQAMTMQEAGYEVADDGSVTHGWRTGDTGEIRITGDNRMWSGDYVNRAPPLAD